MLRFDRRTLLQGSAAIAVAASATPALAATVTRRSVSSLALNSPTLNSYRKAVAAMKALPATDLRNWNKQAQIHNNHCPHRNWYFLPWHRAYLVAFERLCRQLSGDPSFALPYWDWTASPQLPAAFATPNFNGQPNPLFDSTRSSQTVTIPAINVGPAKMSAIYAETSFEVFGSSRPTSQNSTAASWQRVPGIEGPFESGPHDHVHTSISGDMGTFLSPLDPIFWLHHCNIDRAWDHWNSIGRSNAPDTIWRDFAFNKQFVNPSGTSGTTPFNTTVKGVLDIVSLGYRYTLPLIGTVAHMAILSKPIDLAKPLQSFKLNMGGPAMLNAATTARAQLAAPQAQALSRATEKLNELTGTSAQPAKAPGRVMVIFRDVEMPKEGNADVRVFINRPDADANTSTQDRHFAGSFTFFGAGSDHAMHGEGATAAYMLDITQTVNDLQLSGVDLAKEIAVQLVPVPIPGVKTAGEVKVGSVEIAIF